MVDSAKNKLAYNARIVKSSSPKTILSKGFAVVMRNNQILTNPALINPGDQVDIILKEEILLSTVNKKQSNDNRIDF